jgi:hypothetical protein
MKPECAKVAAEVLGRPATKGELDGIETRLLGSMKDLQAQDPIAWRGLSKDERLRRGAKLARQKTVEDMTRAHVNTVRDMEIKARELDNLQSVDAGVGKGKGQLNALNQRTLFHAALEGKGTSLAKDIDAVKHDAMRQLDHFGGKGKFFGAIQDPTEQQALVRAIFGDTSGSPETIAAAKSVTKLIEQLHQRANDAGIHINKLDNWRLPQPWAWEKVAAESEQFVADAMDHIDRSQYMNNDGSPMTDANIQKLVKASAETISTNGSNKRAEKQGTGHSGQVGGSRNAPRQLHFKDADGYLHMMDTYGSAKSAFSLVQHHVSGMARDIATAERFGRDADNFYPQLVEKAFKNDNKAIGADKSITSVKRKAELLLLDSRKKQTLNMWQALRSPDHPGSTPLWARISQNIRGIAQASLLGSSTISAIPDIQMATSYMNLRGIASTRVLGNVAEGIKTSPENVRRIGRLGIVVNTIDASAHRFGNDEMGNGVPKFLNHVVHVASGLRAWDRGMTHGVAASVMDMLGEHSHKTEFHDVGGPTAKMLEQYGVTKDHWNTWRQAELDTGPSGKHTMLTPDNIYSIPDEKLRPMAEQRMAGVSKSFAEAIDKRGQRSMLEAEWMAGRKDKLEALKQRAEETLAQMKARASVKDGHAQGLHDARAEQLRASVDRAGVETDIAGYLKTQGAQAHAQSFLEAVEEGAAVERQTHLERTHPDNKSDAMIETPNVAPGVGDKMNALVQRYGSAVGAKAEAFGIRQGKAEARIADAQKRVDATAKDRAGAINDKAKAFDTKIYQNLFDLADFTKKTRDRQSARAEIDKGFEQRYGQEIQREMRNLRSGAVKQLLSTSLSEAQTGARGGAGTDLRSQVNWGLDPGARGTLRHELMSWLLLLKQTPLGIAKTHMWDVPRSLDTWGASALYRAKFMAGSAMLGAIAQELKDVALGQDPESLFSMKGLGKVAMASGGFGMYGDFAFGDKGDHQNGALPKFLGPGATMAEDALNLVHNAQSTASGQVGITPDAGEPKSVQPDQLLAQGARFAHSYVAPLTRIWYVKAAFNHLVYQQMMENMSPGYNQRIQQRMAQRNQSAWWQPGATAPNRAPNLGTALPNSQP